MSKLERYSSYKDSGVEWLGEIPEGWEIEKLFGLSNFIRGNSNFSKDELLSNGKYIALQYGKTYKVDEIDEMYKFYVNDEFYKESQIVNYGDTIFISTSETIEDLGHSAYYNKRDLGLLGGEQILLNPKKDVIESKYLYSSSKVFSKELKKFATGIKVFRFNTNDLKTIYIPLPSKQEQIKIASFLDRKTKQLDKAIKQKEQLIELLKERRQILINEAVTKGIDKTVAMKDSGVEWIGDVPVHWEVKKVKNIFNLIINPAPNNNDEELLSIYTDIGVKPRRELAEKGNKASTTDGYWIVRKGDFIVNKLLAWMGAIGLSNYDGVTSPAYDILRAKIDTVGIYYHELFRLKVFSEEMKKHSRGIMDMRLRLYFDKFGDIRVPYPLQDEQQLIVNYIEENNQKINNAIDLQQQQITKLKEYKTTLTDSVVTGKVRVCDD